MKFATSIEFVKLFVELFAALFVTLSVFTYYLKLCCVEALSPSQVHLFL